ncbi:MAG TPA: enoyl-CoA hydratase/isomerase family protein [Candidatus Acidoferrales bacterium]|nr:enoyl-CoA hydratase/isomerase family protein [Candidatus Acidoferrales bacterium]
MSTRLVATTREDIVLLTLESDDGYPRLERTVMNALADEMRRLAEAPELAGAVVSGSERAFAVGADIAEVVQLHGTQVFEFSRRGQEVMATVARSPKSVVAAIRGFCLGGGLDLALACHARIATDDAVFAHPGGALGIITGWGGTQRLPRLIGRGRAMEMLVTGSKINAQEAFACGLITGLSSGPELIAEAFRLARRPQASGVAIP